MATDRRQLILSQADQGRAARFYAACSEDLMRATLGWDVIDAIAQDLPVNAGWRERMAAARTHRAAEGA